MRLVGLLALLMSSQSLAADSLERAVAEGNAAGLRHHAETLGANDDARSQLYAAYASWRLATVAEGSIAEEAMNTCESRANGIPEGDPLYGLALAVRATCLGMLANANPAKAMMFGMQSASSLEEALLVAPDDPHVLFVAGMIDYHTPLQWGGDLDRSIRRMRKVIESTTPLDNWVRPEAHAYLAMALGKLKLCDQANEALDAGMALTPLVGMLQGPAKEAVENCEPR